MDQSQKQHHEQTQELHQIQEQVLRLETQVQRMDLKLNAVDTKLDQVLVEMVGNELAAERGGMIKTVSSHELRIVSLEKFRDRLIIIVSVACVFGGYGFWDLVHKLLK